MKNFLLFRTIVIANVKNLSWLIGTIFVLTMFFLWRIFCCCYIKKLHYYFFSGSTEIRDAMTIKPSWVALIILPTNQESGIEVWWWNSDISSDFFRLYTNGAKFLKIKLFLSSLISTNISSFHPKVYFCVINQPPPALTIRFK
jgi:hypothetical protein